MASTRTHQSVLRLITLYQLNEHRLTDKLTSIRRADDISAPALTTDRRGKASQPNKIDHNMIREHINSYHPQISHYNIAHAPHRRYLESSLSVTSKSVIVADVAISMHQLRPPHGQWPTEGELEPPPLVW